MASSSISRVSRSLCRFSEQSADQRCGYLPSTSGRYSSASSSVSFIGRLRQVAPEIRRNTRLPQPTDALANGAGHVGGSSEDRQMDMQFVTWFREAWPYIQGHRGSTFVLVIPGEVIADKGKTHSMLRDVSLMHGLGVRVVLVPGTHVAIDSLLRERGYEPRFHGAYRITDHEALEAAMEASGKIRVAIEAVLSTGPSIPVLRRHGKTDKWHTVPICVDSGNYVSAKRRGVVDGVDFGSTGEVKKVDVARIRARLESNSVVILSNLGYTASGEVLNCNTYEVATAAAVALGADKLVCMLDGPVCDSDGRLIRWMTLQQADLLIRQRASQSYTAANYVEALAGKEYMKALGLGGGGAGEGSTVYDLLGDDWGAEAGEGNDGTVFSAWELEEEAASLARWQAQRALYSMESEQGGEAGAVPVTLHAFKTGREGGGKGGGLEGGGGFAIGGEERLSRTYGYLSELTAAVYACRAGVRRVHLLDSMVEGALLLELYTRDGVGSMVSSDLYEGVRAAQQTDLNGITALLKPLEEANILVPRTPQRLLLELPFFTVVERDGRLIACAALFPFPEDHSAELAAFAVSPMARGSGRGDSLLNYLEKRALDMAIEKLFLLTTRTADWFVHRGFAACSLEDLPTERLKRVDRSRNSKSFMKHLREEVEETKEAQIQLPSDLPKYGQTMASSNGHQARD